METMKISNVMETQLGVVGVPAQACYVRPWHVIGGGLLVAPTSGLSVKQNSVSMATPAADAAPRKKDANFSKNAVARSGIRTEGPPV